MRGFLADSRSRCTAETTINRLCILHAFFRWCRLDDDPTVGIRIARPRPEPKQPYTLAELRRLVAACKTPRNRAIVLLLVATGMRLGELVGLRAEHIDWEAGLLRVEGKGQRRRWVAPGRAAMDALRLYTGGPMALRDGPVWYGRGGHQLTREGVYQIVRAAGVRAGVRKAFVHRFRTTWANEFLNETHDPDAAQVLLGHALLAQTLLYGQWNRAERALEQARAHSLGDRIAGSSAQLEHNFRA